MKTLLITAFSAILLISAIQAGNGQSSRHAQKQGFVDIELGMDVSLLKTGMSVRL